jgi:hypothetical protein
MCFQVKVIQLFYAWMKNKIKLVIEIAYFNTCFVKNFNLTSKKTIFLIYFILLEPFLNK